MPKKSLQRTIDDTPNEDLFREVCIAIEKIRDLKDPPKHKLRDLLEPIELPNTEGIAELVTSYNLPYRETKLTNLLETTHPWVLQEKVYRMANTTIVARIERGLTKKYAAKGVLHISMSSPTKEELDEFYSIIESELEISSPSKGE